MDHRLQLEDDPLRWQSLPGITSRCFLQQEASVLMEGILLLRPHSKRLWSRSHGNNFRESRRRTSEKNKQTDSEKSEPNRVQTDSFEPFSSTIQNKLVLSGFSVFGLQNPFPNPQNGLEVGDLLQHGPHKLNRDLPFDRALKSG